MFYDIYADLCKGAQKAPSRVALDIGINKGTVSLWKSKGTTPQREILQKIATYFNISIDELLGNEKNTAKSDVNLDDFEFAFFGDVKRGDLTEKDIETLKQMARVMRDQNKKEKELNKNSDK